MIENSKTKYLGIITCLFITFELVSDITAGKLIDVFGYPVAVTVLYFPVTYIFSDIITEVYGYARARSVVWTVMLCTVLATLMYMLATAVPPSKVFDANDAYSRVLGQVPQIVIGAWVAVFAGDMMNNYVLAKLKILTKGKLLWLRIISSTIAGQLVNTTLFYIIALWGVIPAGVMITSIIASWIIKSAVEILLTPVTYLVINRLKKAEGIDFYDTNTDFNPFKFTPPF